MSYTDSRSDSYTPDQAAAFLGITPALVLHEIRRGRLKARFREGSEREYFIRKISMEYWQAAHGHKQARVDESAR
jgi:hypothetical protein